MTNRLVEAISPKGAKVKVSLWAFTNKYKDLGWSLAEVKGESFKGIEPVYSPIEVRDPSEPDYEALEGKDVVSLEDRDLLGGFNG